MCVFVMVKSAREHCISSSGQVLNLCDPARDYGGSGSKMGVEIHSWILISDKFRVAVSVFVWFHACEFFIVLTKESFLLLQIKNRIVL